MILINEKTALPNPALKYLSQEIRHYFEKMDFSSIEEIRITRNKPVIITAFGEKKYLSSDGELYEDCENKVIATKKVIEDSILQMSSDSFYTVSDELKRGYISLKGGIRVGVCAKIVYDGEKIVNLKEISSLNIRIPKEVKDDLSNIYKYIERDGKINNCLIISPPNCGKTTLLRNIAKYLSLRKFLVGICDERNEICATYKGQEGFSMGDFCFSMQGRKTDSINMMIRSMAPQCIMCDEIGSSEDIKAIKNALNSGVSVIASIHSENMEKAKQKLKGAYNLFSSFIVLERKDGEFIKTGYYL